MSPQINNIINDRIHHITHDNMYIMIIDNFQYNNNNEIIVPNNDFIVYDINNNSYNIEDRDGMPPLLEIIDGINNYYW